MMKILNDSAGIAAWVQALIYLLTLIVLGYQIYHLRKQTNTQIDTLKMQINNERYSDYIRCQIDFGQTFRELLNKGMHSKIYTSLDKKAGSKFSNWSAYDEDDKLMYGFFEIIYELFERVYCIKQNDLDNKIIDEPEWKYWESWIDDIKRHPVFKDVHLDSKGMFDEKFEELIDQKLKELAK